MKIRRTILAPVVVALAALATGGWFLQQGAGQEQNIYANARLFEEVLEYVEKGFVDKREPAELYQLAIDGMLEELGDPHTVYMPAKEYENLRIQTQGEYGGIGISINHRNGWVTVISPIPGTPGERAGLRAGDAIIEVNGESTREWTDDFAVSKLRGPKGTKVSIKVARPGVDEPLPFDITRAEIHVKSVPAAYMISPEVGYLELSVFSETSTTEVRNAVTDLQKKGAKGIVLDMRGNSGGLLEEGVSVSDLFLDRGNVVLETKGRIPNQNFKYAASSGDEFPGLPVVMLVGPSSASATEIVAGALQDHDRALLVGQTTYGKGSVQTVFRLSDNNWLKMTTARWYTPSGRSIQGPYGIDSRIADGGDGLNAVAPIEGEEGKRPEFRTEAGRVVYGGGGIAPDLEVAPDTLTMEERASARMLRQQNYTKWVEARFAYSTKFAGSNANLKPGFEVTPEMLNTFFEALVKAEVPIDRETFDTGRRWIALELGYEIAMAKWGVAEARKRSNLHDPQVNKAIDLLKNAKTTEELFTLGLREAEAKRTAAK
jgi:carboxyl-terminal processing protease